MLFNLFFKLSYFFIFLHDKCLKLLEDLVMTTRWDIWAFMFSNFFFKLFYFSMKLFDLDVMVTGWANMLSNLLFKFGIFFKKFFDVLVMSTSLADMAGNLFLQSRDGSFKF